jgi:hypothetical protein
LSLHDESWASLYASKSMIYGNPAIWARAAVWLFGSLPTMALFAGWQLWAADRHGNPPAIARSALEPRLLAHWAIAGHALAVLAGLAWLITTTPLERSSLFTRLTWPYALLAVTGLGVQLYSWLKQAGQPALCGRRLLTCTAGLGATLLGAIVTREGLRLAQVDVPALYDHHRRAAEVGGFWLFLSFLIVNALLIAWCLRKVMRRVRPAP